MDSAPASPFQHLVAAVQARRPDEVRALLTRYAGLRAELNNGVANHFGATPLILAVNTGQRELVDALLDAGADINARSDWWAGSFGVLDDDHGLAAHLIARGAIVTPHAAARLGMMDRLRELIAADPLAVHARGGDGQTPLHFASTTEIADLLLANGADINARDIDHESTAAQWMLGDRHHVARHLVAKGCHTDILMAAAIGDRDLVERHLAADPACALMSVSMRWFPKINPRSGGTIYIWTLGWHKCAETVARKFGHGSIEQLMRDVTRDQRDPMRVIAAATNNDLTELTDLLSRGWPADAADDKGTTALHWAAFHGSLAMTTTLLDAGVPIDAVESQHGGRPIDWCRHGAQHGWHRATGDYTGVMKALSAPRASGV